LKVDADYSVLRMKMVERLKGEGIIRSKEVERAFLTVPREEFIWHDTKAMAYQDTPLPLGETGQTISAPHMVAIMLEEFELKQGLKVLEIGAGSGYNAALMAEIVEPTGKDSITMGHIITMERVYELVKFSKENFNRTDYSNRIDVVMGDGTLGYPERSEEMIYDRIMVTAAAPYIPKYLKAQLKINGIILAPVGNTFMQTLVKLTKLKGGRIKTEEICGCVFVSLIGEDGFSS